jgi:hypothetical protein
MSAKDRVRALAFGSLCFTVALYGAALWISARTNPSITIEVFSLIRLEVVMFLWAAIFLTFRPLISEDAPPS